MPPGAGLEEVRDSTGGDLYVVRVGERGPEEAEPLSGRAQPDDAVGRPLNDVDGPVRGDVHPVRLSDLREQVDQARERVDAPDAVVAAVGDQEGAVDADGQAVRR